MKVKCENCGGITHNQHCCPNCKSLSLAEYTEDLEWYNRYASEKMTEQEAIEFFETDKY